MRTGLITLAAILILGAVVPLVHGQHQTGRAVRKELEARYAKIVEAYRRKDIKAFMENKTPDFTARLLNGGVSTRAQTEAGVRQRMERIRRLNYLRIRIKDLTVNGDVATAITAQEFSRVIADQQGREHTVVTKGMTHRETWVKTESGWMLRSVEELTRPTETVDGQVTTPKQAKES